VVNGESAPEPITFQPSIYPKVLSLLPEDKDLRILDAGAGEGYFSRLMRQAGYSDVTACDFLEEIWKCPDVPFVKANLNDGIPLGDASFDCIVSIEVIEHVENHSRFVSELVRLLKPGGTLIISTPNTVTISGRWHFFLSEVRLFLVATAPSALRFRTATKAAAAEACRAARHAPTAYPLDAVAQCGARADPDRRGGKDGARSRSGRARTTPTSSFAIRDAERRGALS
jgi:SAM-dependent methyltransferase